MADFIVDFDEHRMVALAEAASEEAVRVAMTFLLQQANKTVPLEDGTLKNSGRVEVSRGASGAAEGQVTYNTPYARYQHETLTLNHKGQGRAKWLELAALENRDKIQKILETEFAKHMGAA